MNSFDAYFEKVRLDRKHDCGEKMWIDPWVGYFYCEKCGLVDNPIQPDIIFPPTPQEPDDFIFEPEEEEDEEDD